MTGNLQVLIFITTFVKNQLTGNDVFQQNGDEIVPVRARLFVEETEGVHDLVDHGGRVLAPISYRYLQQ